MKQNKQATGESFPHRTRDAQITFVTAYATCCCVQQRLCTVSASSTAFYCCSSSAQVLLFCKMATSLTIIKSRGHGNALTQMNRAHKPTRPGQAPPRPHGQTPRLVLGPSKIR